jgi:hypothetical protein
MLVACTGDLKKQDETLGTDIKTEEARASESEGTLAARVTTLEVQLAALQGVVDGHDTDIAALQTTTAGHTTSIGTLNTTVTGHTTSIGTLGTTTAEHTTDIAGLQTGVAGHTTSINGHTANIATLQSSVSDNTTSIGAIDTWKTKTDTYLQYRHNEELFAWDGADRYLGRILDHDQSGWSVLFVTADSLLVKTSSTAVEMMSFTGTGCTGTPFVRVSQTVIGLPALLAQSNGRIYRPTTYNASLTETSVMFLGPSGGCVNTSSSPSPGYEYTLDRTLSPFTAGVWVAPMLWQ